MRARRWGDHDQYFGPVTYARDRRWKPIAVDLSSADDEDWGCSLRLSAFGHTVIFALPSIIPPYRERIYPESWDAKTVERLGRNWYWQVDRRSFGFTVSDGHLSVHFGRQTNDSSTTRQWGMFLPWTQWRHVRFSLYGIDGSHFWTSTNERDWDAQRAAEERCPGVSFAFLDYDGEAITAATKIDEREWLFGTGWFKWLSLFRRPKIRRSLDIKFSAETGERKGSWKGGTIGHSIDMLPCELHEAAFRRYCAEHKMTFVGDSPTS